MSDLLADHYRTLVEDRGYETADFPLGELPASYVGEAFACADEGRAFAANRDAGAKSLVTVGVSMTGPPHLGTLGQLATAVRFQEAGFDVQVVLADLAAYNAAGRALADVRELARRYRSFALALGFDPEAGVLRTQEGAADVLRTSYLLARYYDPGERGEEPPPTAFEEALADAYEGVDGPGAETTAFAGRQTGLLLASDTLHWAVAEDYENLLFAGGADNHGFSGFFRELLARTPYEATVAGLYGKLVAGLDGYPKMSKSIADSRLALDADPATIRTYVADGDGGGPPEESRVYGLMRLASPYPPEKLDRLRERCARGGEEWAAATEAYADYLVDAAAAWKES